MTRDQRPERRIVDQVYIGEREGVVVEWRGGRLVLAVTVVTVVVVVVVG